MDKQIVINNLLISYSEVQGSSTQTLLFLHGWRSNKEVWNGVIKRIRELENERIGCYLIDLPGFGQSQNPHPNPLPKGEGELGWKVGDYANVVAEFIRKLELKNVIIVGHSFGGRVAIKLAANISPQPPLNLRGGEGVISKLVLVDSAGFAMEASKKIITKAAAKIAKPFFKPDFMQPLRRKIYQKIGAEDYLATPELQKTFVNVTSEDLSDDMKKIQAPTLIIFGENDKETPVTYGELMRFLIPDTKLLILKSAGHFSFLDKPEEFVEALLKFVVS